MLRWRLLLRNLLLMILFAGVYHAAVQVGLLIVEEEAGGISLFWPANGIAMLVLMRLPLRYWPYALFSVLVGYVTAVTPPPRSQGWKYTIGTSCGNLLEIFTASLGIVCGFKGRPICSSAQRRRVYNSTHIFSLEFLVRVLVFAVLIGPLLGAILGSVGVWWQYRQYDVTYYKVYVAWFLGDGLANYMMVYLISIISVYVAHWFQNWKDRIQGSSEPRPAHESSVSSSRTNIERGTGADLSLGVENVWRKAELGFIIFLIIFLVTMTSYTETQAVTNVMLLFPVLFWCGMRFPLGINAAMQLGTGPLMLVLAFFLDGWKWLSKDNSCSNDPSPGDGDGPWYGTVSLHVYLLVHLCSTAVLAVVKHQSDTATMELKRHVEELERQRALTTKLEREAELFTYISHDLKTPLNAVIGFSEEVYNNERLTPDGKEAMGFVLQAGRGLLGTISRLLEAFKLRAGSARLQNVRADIRQLLDETMGTISPLAARKHLKLAINVDESVDSFVFIDKLRFTQILFNLLSNAVKFTNAGSISVNLRRLDCDPHLKSLESNQPQQPQAQEDQYYFELEVIDTGPGIPEEKQSEIFTKWGGGDWGTFDPIEEEQRYARAGKAISLGTSSCEVSSSSSSRTSKFGKFGKVRGSGLGLNIVAEISSLMGGCVHLSSVVGKGTTFTVHIPVRRAPETALVDSGHPQKMDGLVNDMMMEMLPYESQRSTNLDSDGGRGNKRRSSISTLDQPGVIALEDNNSIASRIQQESLAPKKSGMMGLFDLNTPHSITEATETTSNDHDCGLDPELGMKTPDAPSAHSPPEKDVTVPPLRILAAEDVQLNQRLLRRILERLGHHVDIVDDGAAFLRAYDASSKDPYDVMLLDLMMPGLDGYGVLSELQKRKEAGEPKKAPVIVCSAHLSDEGKKKVMDLGADGLADKPYVGGDFQKHFARLLAEGVLLPPSRPPK